jgi:hypothetical protein
MRPSGLGLRLISLQLQPGLALAGERWPFVAFPFPFGVNSIGAGLGVATVATVAFAEVRLVIFLVFIGLLLRDLALLNSALESELSSISSIVVGPKYPSCASLASEGVGEGEITVEGANQYTVTTFLKRCSRDRFCKSEDFAPEHHIQECLN